MKSLAAIQAQPDTEIRARARGALSEPLCKLCDSTGVPLHGVNGGQHGELVTECPSCGKAPPNMHTARFRQALASVGGAEVMTKRRRR
mgnify:FL=1